MVGRKHRSLALVGDIGATELHQTRLAGRAGVDQGQEHDLRSNFRAAFGILKWEPSKPPEYALIVKMALLDSDSTTKIMMLLVEPGETDGWDRFIIKRLRRCVYKADLRSCMVDTQFPIFNNVEQLRRVVRALLAWMLVQTFRLSDICCGRWQDLRLRQHGPI